MNDIAIAIGEGRSGIEISATLTGEGVNILLTGGEKPHIGAVVMAIPGSGGCETRVLIVPPHRDVEAAQPVAKMICSALGQVTVVTAGIHINNAEKWEIEELLNNTREAARQLLIKIEGK
ncbi:MAG: prenylated flavin chaperone LpdD [Thermincolia bacterium]